MCSDFVKFGRREIGEIVRCLPDKKIRLALHSLQLSLLATARIAPQICHVQPPTMYSVLRISSKSVHFRRSYSRTREHRQNVP